MTGIPRELRLTPAMSEAFKPTLWTWIGTLFMLPGW
jgi:hypothetical protein